MNEKTELYWVAATKGYVAYSVPIEDKSSIEYCVAYPVNGMKNVKEGDKISHKDISFLLEKIK